MKSNQFFDNFKPSLLDRINTFYYRLLGVKIGSSSYIMYGAKLERNIKNIIIGNNVIIKPFTRICSCNDTSIIKIDNYVTIGHYSFIYSSIEISIGSHVMIAPFAYIVDSNHNIDKNDLMIFQKNTSDSIKIESDVWIGQNSTILKGVVISTGSVIGAKSLVSKSTESYEIHAGVPNKLIGLRK